MHSRPAFDESKINYSSEIHDQPNTSPVPVLFQSCSSPVPVLFQFCSSPDLSRRHYDTDAKCDAGVKSDIKLIVLIIVWSDTIKF